MPHAALHHVQYDCTLPLWTGVDILGKHGRMRLFLELPWTTTLSCLNRLQQTIASLLMFFWFNDSNHIGPLWSFLSLMRELLILRYDSLPWRFRRRSILMIYCKLWDFSEHVRHHHRCCTALHGIMMSPYNEVFLFILILDFPFWCAYGSQHQLHQSPWTLKKLQTFNSPSRESWCWMNSSLNHLEC